MYEVRDLWAHVKLVILDWLRRRDSCQTFWWTDSVTKMYRDSSFEEGGATLIEWYWGILRDIEGYWEILRDFERYWEILIDIDRYWYILIDIER